MRPLCGGQKFIKKNNYLQKLACIGITGTIKTAPTAAFEVCFGLHPPLPYFIDGLILETPENLDKLLQYFNRKLSQSFLQ